MSFSQRSGLPNIALFDFDGTISEKETFSPFLRLAIKPKRLLICQLILSPLILAYKAGLFPGHLLRRNVVFFGLRKRKAKELRELGMRYATDILPTTLRPLAMERIEWHKKNGDTIVVVSASLNFYLSHWCQLNSVDLICSVLQEESGFLTGRYLDGDCFGKEKVRRIVQSYNLESYDLIYAYGDTAEDRDMLDIADKKFFCWKEL